jgi:hypothetical protein
MSWIELRIMSHMSIRINKIHKDIIRFDDSKLRREEEFEALPREVVWMRPLAAQHVTFMVLSERFINQRSVTIKSYKYNKSLPSRSK